MGASKRIDEERAQRLLDAGLAIREVAHACGVSTQAVYLALKTGRLARPEVAA
jgi:AcrR family transcriptional regulator